MVRWWTSGDLLLHKIQSIKNNSIDILLKAEEGYTQLISPFVLGRVQKLKVLKLKNKNLKNREV